MKKFFIIFLLTLFLPYVSAQSVFTGWIRVPSHVGIEGKEIELKDVSLDGRFLVLTPKGNFFVTPGETVNSSIYSLRLISGFVKDDGGYAKLNITFPYILENQTLLLGDYKISLISVGDKEAKIRLLYKNTSKEILYSGGKIEFNELLGSFKIMPTIFDGYLYKGGTKEIYEWTVKFEDFNITEVNGEFREFVGISINGKEHWVGVGKTIEADGIIIDVKDLVGSSYVRVLIKLKGVYATLSISPSVYKEVEEGKDTQIGPYLVRVEKVFSDGAYVTIRNFCGMTLKSGWVYTNTLISYGGLYIGVEGIKDLKTKKIVTLVGFLESEKIPKPEADVFVNVSFSTPEKALQFEPFNATVVIKNEGEKDLHFVEIIPNLTSGFKITSPYPTYIPELKAKESIHFNLTLLSENSGLLKLGSIKVRGNVPFQLSCDGFARISFSSEIRWINIENASPYYLLSIQSSDGSIGEPIPLNITVVNKGNTRGPFTLTIALPEHFGIIGDKLTASGRFAYITGSLKPGENKTYSFYFIPTKEGEFEVLAALKEREYIAKNSTIVKIEAPKISQTQIPEGTKETEVSSNSTKIVETYTETITYTEIRNTTIEIFPTKQKLLFAGGGFVGGMIFILLLAWIAAKLEERSGR
ncbi:hypothetical protein ADU37_CDS10860 [Thermococcus sp. 2319x1]|uniref:hypothetical protein n=1 Tax=Thermococcus sp. 2319x1 TaxID=1674923 RepID=UPI00073ADADB|nr:hypothetical protein [Thermococcus sp. 2319x1]ALV62785.1 hypothetical protein ADU37_CDS10860 [Thermococcus sp. 2319x1]